MRGGTQPSPLWLVSRHRSIFAPSENVEKRTNRRKSHSSTNPLCTFLFSFALILLCPCSLARSLSLQLLSVVSRVFCSSFASEPPSLFVLSPTPSLCVSLRRFTFFRLFHYFSIRSSSLLLLALAAYPVVVEFASVFRWKVAQITDRRRFLSPISPRNIDIGLVCGEQSERVSELKQRCEVFESECQLRAYKPSRALIDRRFAIAFSSA